MTASLSENPELTGEKFERYIFQIFMILALHLMVALAKFAIAYFSKAVL